MLNPSILGLGAAPGRAKAPSTSGLASAAARADILLLNPTWPWWLDGAAGSFTSWGDRTVRLCRTRTELYLAAGGMQVGTIIVDASTTDGIATAANMRVLERLGSLSGAERCLAYADPTPDLAAAAGELGVRLIDPSSPTGPAELQTARVRSRWSEEAWSTWIERAYGLTPSPQLEAILSLLAAGQGGSVIAVELVERGLVAQRSAAVRLIRITRKALACEEYKNDSLVAAEAAVVLAGLAGARPLRWRPQEPSSFERAVALLDRMPSLQAAAAVSDREAADLQAIGALLAEARDRSRGNAGAPPADQLRLERDWASARLASKNGATRASIEQDAQQILDALAAAAAAIGSALAETLRAPQAHLAAGLALLAERAIEAPSWAERGDGTILWRGLRPDLVAALPPTELDDATARLLAAEVDDRIGVAAAGG